MKVSMKMNRIDDVHIRKAGAEDASKAVEFMGKLIEYQKMKDIEVLTEDTFINLIEKGGGEAIFGEIDSEPVAFMYYFRNSSAFTGKTGIYIDAFYVDEEYRGNGIGKSMLRYVAELALGRGCGRMEWVCMDWNEPSIRFYENLGAKSMYNKLTVYRMDEDTMKSL